ncbi:MAG TPA: GNAT family N-acetyltransferase [Methanoregulaceae archaeon]|nr:GNAT family N-acetyltransferase [Methanoregulaceae archaeon]HPD76214.1 GNAT family N-acetyltransferase [Methanoregulaceae archaeon]
MTNGPASCKEKPGLETRPANTFITSLPNRTPTMPAIVRNATPTDTGAIFRMGSEEEVFGVSPRIRFYERQELDEWVASPQDNLLLVLDCEGEVRGFLFCKLMSSHWAYLDNFYVHPAARGHGYGKLLIQALLDLLRERKIAYLSTLVAEHDPYLSRYFESGGLAVEKTYWWLERFVE